MKAKPFRRFASELLSCKFGGSYSFDFLSMIQARLTGLVKDEDSNN
jgi:hypothetical protein